MREPATIPVACAAGSRCAAVFLLMSLLPAGARGAVMFQGLGALPSGVIYSNISEAYAVNSDGSVIVGHASSGTEAFRWTSAGGMEGLGDLPGGSFRSRAFAVNADGSVVVGQGNSNIGGDQAFRWTSAGGMQALGNLPAGFISQANAVSGDGSVVVGHGDVAGQTEAFRWTSASGMQGLGDLPGGGIASRANAVNADGSIVVGRGNNDVNGGLAFRWTANDGMQPLSDLPGGNVISDARGISPDGSIIVGYSASASGAEACRWIGGAVEGLGDLPGGVFFSVGLGVSGDGSIIVGYGTTGFTSSATEAFIWDPANGMRGLQSVLVNDYELDLTGWTLREARGISADGSTIVGIGRNPDGRTEAWMAVIPEPSSFALLATGAVALSRRARRRSG